GLGSLARILTHTMIAEWQYIERLQGHEVPEYERWPIRDEAPPPFPTIDSTWAGQAVRSRAAIAAVRDWDAPVVYRVTDDAGRRMEVRATAGGIVTQLAFHEVYHRAQLLNILRRLGAEDLGDLDF